MMATIANVSNGKYRIDRRIVLNSLSCLDWEIGNYEPGYLAPSFSAKEGDGEVVGRFGETGKPAIAVKKLDGYTSVF